MSINIRSLINDHYVFTSLMAANFFSMQSLSMHEEDERPPNEKSYANHFSITYNGCDFCLLAPPAILALPKCLFKG